MLTQYTISVNLKVVKDHVSFDANSGLEAWTNIYLMVILFLLSTFHQNTAVFTYFLISNVYF